jgi:small-conductance mechanosensitive channel
MGQYVYRGLTTYVGMYLCYLLPITYSMTLVYKVVNSRLRRQERLRGQDISVIVTLLLIVADFVRYLYLWLTHTGRLLPSPLLLLKYVVGGCLWIGIVWYLYSSYFCRQVAGEQFKTRRMTLVGICIGSLILAVIGMIVS